MHEARAWSADLLVLGTHGRRGAARLLLGSVAETVLRNEPCGVLVMPPAPIPQPADGFGRLKAAGETAPAPLR